MTVTNTSERIETPTKVLSLTAPDGEFVIECFDIPTFAFQGMVKAFDPEAFAGRGGVELTQHKDKALRFKDFLAACDCWKMQSKRRPIRDDGKPNRPLTAYTIQISKYVDAPKGALPKT